jgi:hypothetical protein
MGVHFMQALLGSVSTLFQYFEDLDEVNNQLNKQLNKAM